MSKVLVIGGGFAGCCAAHMISEKGYDVTLIERDNFLGGGCKTFFYGGHPYTYGPRHFLTRNEELFNYLHQFVPMRRIEHDQFNYSFVEKEAAFYNYPFHYDDIARMPDKDVIYEQLKHKGKPQEAKNFEEYVVFSIGENLYNKLVKTYTKKMWKIDSPTELDSGGNWGWRGWSPQGFPLRTGSKSAWSDAISGFPYKINGYDDYFDAATKDCKVHLSTSIEEFDIPKYRVKVSGQWHSYDIIVSTIAPEILMNNAFGPLRWMGREFFKIVLPVEWAFPKDVYFLYYTNEEPFTRIVEYKKFYQYEAPSTLIILEIPSNKNKLYPYPTEKDEGKAKQYFDSLPPNVYSIGRMGRYRYIDMDDIIEECMELVSHL